MDSSLSWWTRGRMVLALLLLALVPIVAVAVGVVGFLLSMSPVLVVFPIAGIPLPIGYLALVVGIGLLAAVLTQRRSLRRAIERGAQSPLDDLPTRAPEPDLEATVERLAAQADVDAPAVTVVETEALEAFTVRHDGEPTVAVSEGVLFALSDAELRGVLAHELSHLRSRDLAVMRWATLPLASGDELQELAAADHVEHDPPRAGTDDEFPLPGDGSVDDDGPDRIGLAMAAVLSSFGRACARMVSVGREYAADAGAAAITGEPTALASALATLDDELDGAPQRDLRERADVLALNVVPAGSRGLLSTHPPTEKRIERLQSMADGS